MPLPTARAGVPDAGVQDTAPEGEEHALTPADAAEADAANGIVPAAPSIATVAAIPTVHPVIRRLIGTACRLPARRSPLIPT